MTTWFYYNKKGDKVGPIPLATLRLLVQRGIIGPDTVVENQNGRSSAAGQIRGLFPEKPVQLERIPAETSAVTNDVPLEEPISNEVYGLALTELPKPLPVESRPAKPIPVASDPFTMPVSDNPFSPDPSVEVESVPVPPTKQPAKKELVKKESAEQSALEGSYIYAAEKWIRKNPELVERIVERIAILLMMILVCFRILPAILFLLLLIGWFAFDLVRQVKKGNDDS